MINILNHDATINENGTKEFEGLDRFEARKKVVDVFKSLNLFVKEEKIIILYLMVIDLMLL